MATLEQAFQKEKAWIAACEDVDALIEKIGDYREDVRVSERDGHMLMRMRAGDLIELAQSRVVGLQARAMRAERVKQPTQVSPSVGASAPQAERAKPPVPPVAKVEQDPQRSRATAEAAASATTRAKADARLVAAEAERVELQNALLRAHIEATRQAASAAPPNAAQVPHVECQSQTPTTAAAAPSGRAVPRTTTKQAAMEKPAEDRRASSGNRAPLPKPAATKDEPPDCYSEADRLALASVGRWPPMPADRRSAFWTRDADWPPEWTLTGGDLGRFRGELNVTRAVFAAQLGVLSVVIKDAEMRPREKVGPALQIALRKAMEAVGEQRRREREERRAAAESAARPVLSVAGLDGVGAGALRVSATEAKPAAPEARAHPAAPAAVSIAAFTGRDLARLRAERGLTQREMAELLGVEQGTISKGESKGEAQLGPGLQEAMARVEGPCRGE
jgi:DNA-binding transcriptional regulator YiaG